MMRKARLAIRKVNVALDSPGYYFGTSRRQREAPTRRSRSRFFQVECRIATLLQLLAGDTPAYNAPLMHRK
jgi:hypothetical protein